MGHRLLPFRPEMYHGRKNSRPYFEGWYFKHAGGGSAFTVIPGIFRSKRKSEDTAFIQVILTGPQRSFFVAYTSETFRCSEDRFELSVGNSFFSMEKAILKIGEISLEAELKYSGITPLKKSICSPSIMGPFSYLPSMQCNHGVLSLRHKVKGFVDYCGKKTEFKDADGYIEKDWGESFPESWIWMQCCDKDTAFMCSVAKIPYGPLRFTGLIAVLLIGGEQYRFATYNGAKITSIDITDNNASVEVKRGDIKLCAEADFGGFADLKAPSKTGMNRSVSESITGNISLTLYKRHTIEHLGVFKNAGLEMSNAEGLIRK